MCYNNEKQKKKKKEQVSNNSVSCDEIVDKIFEERFTI